ncbi:ADP/ATP carrier protein, putative [Plasmodium malariae]|uniref:ADP/ATP carrier protein, putative n=2 Tax=Plasmodium (Plasmodium) TaxID=418103 RepID=A0A1D3PAP8_PLAMA|nr:ADP/ATP carrier protein, putative [Plasmodium malariae]SCN12081.1 ADP/ATP carrier protein, putative [Plasmodium malariae]
MESYYLKKKKKIKYKELFITTFLTHGGSNLISKLIVSPLERTVIIKQVRPVFFKGILLQPSFAYSNIIRSIHSNQGVTSFWWGYNASILSFLSFSFLRLLFHDRIKYSLSLYTTSISSTNNSSNYNYFFVKFFLLYTSSCLAATIAYPLDTIHNCMQLNHEIIRNKKLHNRSIFLFIYDQLLKKKIKNLYAGYSLCLFSFIPYLIITIKLNELFTKHFIDFSYQVKSLSLEKEEQKNEYNTNEDYKKLFNKTPSFFPYIFLGVLTGYVAQIATYPLETIRRTYQYHVMYEQYFPKLSKHFKILYKEKCSKTLINKISNLYKGFTMHSFKLIPEYFIFSCFFYYVKNNIPI